MLDLLKENALWRVRRRWKRWENLVGEYLLHQEKSKDVSVSDFLLHPVLQFVEVVEFLVRPLIASNSSSVSPSSIKL